MASPKLWFSPKSVRRISIRSYAGLVGKAPTKQKRLKILLTMPVTGNKVTGYPEWLEEAITFVMKTGSPVKPPMTIDYCNIVMSDQNLFQATPIEAPRAKLSHFSVENMGSEDEPITVVKFQVMCQFSTDLNRWCGQMNGEEFDSTYQVTEAPPETQEEDEDEEHEDDALKGEGETIVEADYEKERQAATSNANDALFPASVASKSRNQMSKAQRAAHDLLSPKSKEAVH